MGKQEIIHHKSFYDLLSFLQLPLVRVELLPFGQRQPASHPRLPLEDDELIRRLCGEQRWQDRVCALAKTLN